MGCINSKIEVEESVRRCKERRKLMKKLLMHRSHLSVAHFTYLKSLRDTGSTLRQFVELEFISDPTKTPNSFNLPPSPPPLPPSPPPLQFSPIVKRNRAIGANCTKDNCSENFEIDSNSETESCVTTPRPPPPPPGSNWGIWDPFDPITLNSVSILGHNDNYHVNSKKIDLDDEDWEETNTDFEEDEQDNEEKIGREREMVNKERVLLGAELGEDNISMLSWHTKESDVAMRTNGVLMKKSLNEIVREIDEYFLKAAAAGKDVGSVLEMDSNNSNPWEVNGKKGKVF